MEDRHAKVHSTPGGPPYFSSSPPLPYVASEALVDISWNTKFNRLNLQSHDTALEA